MSNNLYAIVFSTVVFETLGRPSTEQNSPVSFVSDNNLLSPCKAILQAGSDGSDYYDGIEQHVYQFEEDRFIGTTVPHNICPHLCFYCGHTLPFSDMIHPYTYKTARNSDGNKGMSQVDNLSEIGMSPGIERKLGSLDSPFPKAYHSPLREIKTQLDTDVAGLKNLLLPLQQTAPVSKVNSNLPIEKLHQSAIMDKLTLYASGGLTRNDSSKQSETLSRSCDETTDANGNAKPKIASASEPSDMVNHCALCLAETDRENCRESSSGLLTKFKPLKLVTGSSDSFDEENYCDCRKGPEDFKEVPEAKRLHPDGLPIPDLYRQQNCRDVSDAPEGNEIDCNEPREKIKHP